MENLQYYNRMKSVPTERLKKIWAWRLKGMSDINPQWRIEKLTETFWPCGIGWKVSDVKYDYKELWDEIVCNCTLNLHIKHEWEWSDGIFWVWGSRFATNEKNWVYVSDEAQKMAFTDAISVAGKMLWLASDVYMWLSDSKYSAQSDTQWVTEKRWPTNADLLLEALRNAQSVEELLERGKQIDTVCVSEKQKEFFRKTANKRYKELNTGEGEDLSKQNF